MSVDQQFRNHPRNKWKARKADKKGKTIASRFVRELECNLLPGSKYTTDIELFKLFLQRKMSD
ncbi:MAG: hypothetical protein WCS79_01910 [Paludibacter sp.]